MYFNAPFDIRRQMARVPRRMGVSSRLASTILDGHRIA
jgi:hypothetical protein